MSPLLLRRYRAERLLREQFKEMRGGVLRSVRARLRASGAMLDQADLDACYSLAWQGLYAAVLDGEEIENTGGWLALATYRRAIDEHRARGGRRPAGPPAGAPAGEIDDALGAQTGGEADLAAELDDRVRLRQLFEALRGRLSERELQAATLCYLQGLSRSEAASAMGVSDSRMRKLMDGDGARRPGVAAKMGALVETITRGGWCAEQGSLMRGLAYGVLDPAGERYRLAQLHRSECPACRAYVRSLRGLAATLPPLPSFLHLLGAGTGAGAGMAAGTGAAPPTPAVAGAGTTAGVAGAGAAGGGWALAGGSVGAKLAMGCLLALSVGAGCVALSGLPHGRPPARAHTVARSAGHRSHARSSGKRLAAAEPAGSTVHESPAALSPAARAAREFGLEQGASGGETALRTSTGSRKAVASTSSSEFEQVAGAGSTGTHSAPARLRSAPTRSAARAASSDTSSGASQAEREFGIG